MTGLFKTALSAHIVRSSARVALVVGAVLNLINQGPSIISGIGVSWLHVLLNFVVPYCVASYSAAKAYIARTRNESSNLPRA